MSKKPSRAQIALDELLGIANTMIVDDSQTNEIEVIPVDEHSQDVVTYEALPQEDVEKRAKQENDIEDDYKLARDTLRNLIGDGQSALNKMLEMMAVKKRVDSQVDDDEERETMFPTPRAIEVTSGLIRNIAEVSKDLLDLQKRKQDLNNPKGSPSTPERPATIIEKETNLIVFNGSTNELGEILKQIDNESGKPDGD